MPEKCRILIVDDEPDLVRLVCLRLEASGYEVLVAMDGEAALAKARVERPDLILLDLMLPKMDGYQVCRLLKNDTRTAPIPIAIFTARRGEYDEELGKECGADAYIRKPFWPEELLETIRLLLLKSHGSKAGFFH